MIYFKNKKQRWCTVAFMLIVNEARRIFENYDTATKIRFAEKGYTVYYKEDLVLKFARFTPELLTAYEQNGNRPFTLTRAQVTGCFWNTK